MVGIGRSVFVVVGGRGVGVGGEVVVGYVGCM